MHAKGAGAQITAQTHFLNSTPRIVPAQRFPGISAQRQSIATSHQRISRASGKTPRRTSPRERFRCSTPPSVRGQPTRANTCTPGHRANAHARGNGFARAAANAMKKQKKQKFMKLPGRVWRSDFEAASPPGAKQLTVKTVPHHQVHIIALAWMTGGPCPLSRRSRTAAPCAAHPEQLMRLNRAPLRSAVTQKLIELRPHIHRRCRPRRTPTR